MVGDLEKQNEVLRRKICQLELQIDRNGKKQVECKQLQYFPIVKDEPIQDNWKTCNSEIDFSPIHTCQSLQEDTISLDMYPKGMDDQVISTCENKNNKISSSKQEVGTVRFQVENNIIARSNTAHYQTQKQIHGGEIKLKKSVQSVFYAQPFNAKTVYNSAIRDKKICEQCVIKMHQMYQMQFLKNKYHKQYICVRTQLQKLKFELNQREIQQTQRTSANLTEMCYDQNNEEKSEKSSFSFQNIENTLLSERFSLQIQEFTRLIDRMIPLDIKFIELTPGDLKLLLELELKVQKLKSHIGLDTEPKYLGDLFAELQKSELSIKKIHQRYRKLFEKMVRVHKQKIKKDKEEFNQVNGRFILLLEDLNLTKMHNQRLSYEMQSPKTRPLSSSVDLRSLRKCTLNIEPGSGKQKDLPDSCLLELSRRSSLSQTKLEMQVQKYQRKFRNNERENKRLQKLVRQLQSQIIYAKKKSQDDLNQFIDSIVTRDTQKLRNAKLRTQKSQCGRDMGQTEESADIQGMSDYKAQAKRSIQEIGSLVYEIFSFTSCESIQDQNVFQPQTPEQIVSMLTHIKVFAHKFDLWQKQKQKQISQFQRDFLKMLKFLINNSKLSKQELLEEIGKMQDNQPLLIYIKKYYSKSGGLTERFVRLSSSFSFGQKQQTCKDSQAQI